MSKAVFVINQLNRGGAAKMIKFVSNIAVSVFDEVTIVDLFDEEYNGDDVNPKIPIVGLGFGKRNRISRRLFLIPKLRSCIKTLKPEYVISFIGHVNFMSRVATLNIKNLTFISAERGDPFCESSLWKKRLEWTYKKSDYNYFQLENARDFFSSKVREKSFVIPNPVILHPDIKPHWGTRKKTIVGVGRFSPEKCFDDLIKAFAIVHKSHPEYSLILYGDGRMRTSYEELICNLGLSDYVSMPGYINNVANTLKDEGIFVLSSLYEGIPNALIEAMSVGLPCVSTDCTPGGPAFLFNHEERGILVPVHNTMSMASAIIKLIENEDMSDFIGRNASKIKEEFNKEKISQMWIDSFNKIISNH